MSKLLLRRCNGTDRQTDRQTDGRTPYRYIDPASHTMRAEPMKSGMRAKASHYRPRCQVVVNAGLTQDDNQACCHLHRRHRRRRSSSSSSSIRIQQQHCQRASVDCDIDCQIDVVDDESADELCRRVACGVSSRRTRCTRPILLGDNTSTKLPSRAKYAVLHSSLLTITITIVAKQHEEQMTRIHHLFRLFV